MTTRAFGARIKRNEVSGLLRGKGAFVGDLNPAGALHAAVLRSASGHAPSRDGWAQRYVRVRSVRSVRDVGERGA